MNIAESNQLFQNAAYTAVAAFERGKEADLEHVSRCITIMTDLMEQADAQMIINARGIIERKADRRKQ